MGYTKKHKAAAKVAGCKPSELKLQRWDHYGLEIYGYVGGGNSSREYAVGLDDEADEAAGQYIKDSLWAFTASFLAEQTDLPEEIFTSMQDQCEGANETFTTLVERSDGGMEGFIDEAISADGRGHFLSNYNGEEHEVEIGSRGLFTTLYVYEL